MPAYSRGWREIRWLFAKTIWIFSAHLTVNKNDDKNTRHLFQPLVLEPAKNEETPPKNTNPELPQQQLWVQVLITQTLNFSKILQFTHYWYKNWNWILIVHFCHIQQIAWNLNTSPNYLKQKVTKLVALIQLTFNYSCAHIFINCLTEKYFKGLLSFPAWILSP